MRPLIPLIIFGFFAFARASEADDSATQVAFFEQRIRPVFVEHCYQCHSESAEKLRGGLLLDSKAGWMAGGDSAESAIVPGDPKSSLLIRYLRYEGGLEMPPSGKLPNHVIADFQSWVQSGAVDPRDSVVIEAKRADKSWWSLQPIRSGTTGDDASEPTIDSFINAKLSESELRLNPPADARTLIRRMTYDVTGLPPSPTEVKSFIKQFGVDADEAVETLVDRLLDSPQYGEQWGRHWLDVVRFGESNGFERNFLIDDLWPFRDYVINSLNDDKPMNQFITEHLAGDVIGEGKPTIEIGSAFLVAGPYDDVGNQDVVAQANIRAATLDEVITATSGAFLGLTVNCARCHHHKFDPIPAEDYYRLRAAFEGIKHGRRVVASESDKEAHRKATRPLAARQKQITAELAEIETAIANQSAELIKTRQHQRPKIDPLLIEESFSPVKARHVKFVFHAHTGNAETAVGSRLVEVQVWTPEPSPINVALATAGGTAEGNRSAIAEDFLDAYGPQFTIDGKSGEQWFIGNPAELTIHLPEVEIIDRVTLSNAKGKDLLDTAQGSTPCEYEVEVSLDGIAWTRVASGEDRQPWSDAHARRRVRNDVITPEQTESIAALQRELAEVRGQLQAIEPLPQMWVGNPAEPKEPTRLHTGGDPMKPADEIAPSSLDVLSETVQSFELPIDAPESQRRLELAKWIVSNDNPLTPRVLANRVWQHHFGVGIVDTPSDFGFLGSEPTHPQLLDHLAQVLLRNEWRLKPLHREILLSKTYRQSSAYREKAAQIDSDSRTLWRFPPRRLSAEEIRDSMLFVSGKLDARRGGPGFRLYKFTQNNVSTYFPLDRHGPDTYRRAVYHQTARASVVDLLTDFDLPDSALATPRRSSTTTPLQALTLLNHSFTQDMAEALVERTETVSEDALFVETVYQHVLQRLPTAIEREHAEALVRSHGETALCRAMFNMNEVLYVE